MKCLRKYQWVKLPRDYPDMGKGIMGYWSKLASRAAFRKGNAHYCGHSNPVTPGMWAGGVVGLKSILGIRSRAKALQILQELERLGYLKFTLDRSTKKLSYEITDWVVKCSGAECLNGAVYATEGYCKYKEGSENNRLNHMIAWYSRKVIEVRRDQSAQITPENRVAHSNPLTRAYFSHGWNCKHCRNCMRRTIAVQLIWMTTQKRMLLVMI